MKTSVDDLVLYHTKLPDLPEEAIDLYRALYQTLVEVKGILHLEEWPVPFVELGADTYAIIAPVKETTCVPNVFPTLSGLLSYEKDLAYVVAYQALMLTDRRPTVYLIPDTRPDLEALAEHLRKLDRDLRGAHAE